MNAQDQKPELPMTQLPDGSGCFTSTVMSKEEAMKLLLKKRPLCFRISSEMYHAVFEAIGAASMCWKPRPSNEVFSSEEAAKIATDLCFKIANEIESKPLPPLEGELKDILGRMIYGTAGIGKRLHELKLYDVPRRAEEEQAAALHWMLNLYLKHGDGWRTEGEKILKAQT